MGMMPTWFAKTPEMYAFDKHFSLADAKTPAELVRRCQVALRRLMGTNSYFEPEEVDTLHPMGAPTIAASMAHFKGDWISAHYPSPPDVPGGNFWPQIGSQEVVDKLRAGAILALRMALGETAMEADPDLAGSAEERRELFSVARENGVPYLEVQSIQMVWVCVAPVGDTYFEVDVTRGMSSVTLSIGTPKPMGHSFIMPQVQELERQFALDRERR